MVKRIGSNYDSPKHIPLILTNSIYSPRDFRASWPMFFRNLWKKLFSCFTHFMPLLKSLHLLPFIYHIILKICIITYQALSCEQPSYLHCLLTPIRKHVQLRSSSSDLLFVHKVKTNIMLRAFAVGAPTLWDMFPSSVISVENISKFRHYLNIHLQPWLSTVAGFISESFFSTVCLGEALSNGIISIFQKFHCVWCREAQLCNFYWIQTNALIVILWVWNYVIVI